MQSAFSFQDSPAAAYLSTHIFFSPFPSKRHTADKADGGFEEGYSSKMEREWVPHSLPLSSRGPSVAQLMLGKTLLNAKETDACKIDLTFVRKKSFQMRRAVERNLAYNYLTS